MFLGIELGGTKVLVSMGTGPDDLTVPVRIDTRGPADTCIEILRVSLDLQSRYGPIRGVGIGSFGPIGVKKGESAYGAMLQTPKPGWSSFPLLETLRAGLPDVAMALDTDVNAAALAEGMWGGARGLDTFAYVTVGTGIGVGLISSGLAVHGLLHPEAGHIRVTHSSGDHFAGCCPFHGDCLEGLASGPAVNARLGVRGEEVADESPVWQLVGSYLAQLYYNLLLIGSPQRILVGGGVGLKAPVLSSSRLHLHELLGGYIEALKERSLLERYVVAAELGDRAGILGAIALARYGNGSPLSRNSLGTAWVSELPEINVKA